MKARVIVTTAPPEVVAGGADLARDVLIPAARERAGYRGYIALYDAERGHGMSVTLWDDAETEQASDEASRESREHFARLFGADVVVEKYDVAAAEVR